MPEWEERIVQATRPSIRVEHDLRYAAAAPLVAGAPVWCDLGCGTGVAAAAALRDRFTGHAVLVDVAQEALDEAAAAIHAGETTALAADLADEAAVARVGEAIRAAGGGGVVTCFEVIEHLATFVPVLELLRDLAERDGFTVLLSVPNDAFWALENPYHQAMWGEGAFEELRRLLPREHVAARQVPLTGSAIVLEDGGAARVGLEPVTVEADRVPSHFLAAFGPRARELAPGARAIAADLDDQRTWERQREANLAFFEAAAHPGNHRGLLRRLRPGGS
jgi:2-polyprenyl-3-methyl-5-hydroxy-6-metoxy-1,4-benzoquinol methylase